MLIILFDYFKKLEKKNEFRGVDFVILINIILLFLSKLPKVWDQWADWFNWKRQLIWSCEWEEIAELESLSVGWIK